MSIAFTCGCGKALKAKDEWAGKTVKCPRCGKPAKIPTGGGASSPRAAKSGSKAGGGSSGSGSQTTKTAKKSALVKPASSDDIALLPEEPRRKPDSDLISDDEMFTEEQVSSLRATTKPCPFCGKPIFEGDPLCINCGTDLKTGKKIQKKKERVPLGPYIKLGVIVVVVVVGGIYGWIAYKKTTVPPSNTGPSVEQDKTAPARAALRDGNLRDFKGFAKAIAGLSQEEILALLQGEFGGGDSSQGTRDKATLSMALLAWYGFSSPETIQILAQQLQVNEDDRVRVACLEGLYAAGTAPGERYLPVPAPFEGLEKDLATLPKTEPASDALQRVIEKADGAVTVELQIKSIQLAVLSGYPDRMFRLVDLLGSVPEKKAAVLKAIQQLTARTFTDEVAVREWWTNEGQPQNNPKVWVASRLDPSNSTEDLKSAVRVLSHLTGEDLPRVTDKSSDDEVKAAAAKWKEWCDANPDKVQAP